MPCNIFTKFENQSLDCLFFFVFPFLNPQIPEWLKLSHQPPLQQWHWFAYLQLDLPFNWVNSPPLVVTGQSFVKRQHCALQETSGVDNLVRKEVHLEAISWCKTRGHNDHLLTLFPFPSTSLVFSIMIKASSEQSYITSTINTDYTLWQLQLVNCRCLAYFDQSASREEMR